MSAHADEINSALNRSGADWYVVQKDEPDGACPFAACPFELYADDGVFITTLPHDTSPSAALAMNRLWKLAFQSGQEWGRLDMQRRLRALIGAAAAGESL